MFYDELGKTIKLYRKINHLSMTELGEKIGRSKATISKYEKGAIAIDVETLILICGALGIDVTQLLREALPPEMNPKSEMDANRFSGPTELFSSCYDGLRNRFIKGKLVIRSANQVPSSVSFYYDIPDYTSFEICKNLYRGEVYEEGNIINFKLQNFNHSIENVMITAIEPIQKSSYYIGLVLGLSAAPIIPNAYKIVLSTAPISEDEELIKQLSFSKEQLNSIKKGNIIFPI